MKSWAELNSFLISIPNEDAREILKLTHDNDPIDGSHMVFPLNLAEVQQAMARVRRKVWMEVLVWASIFFAVAGSVATILIMR
jgi:hypothetical protein